MKSRYAIDWFDLQLFSELADRTREQPPVVDFSHQTITGLSFSVVGGLGSYIEDYAPPGSYNIANFDWGPVANMALAILNNTNAQFNSKSHAVLIWSDRSYRIATTIVPLGSGVCMRGAGREATHLSWQGSASQPVIQCNTGWQNGFIEDLSIDASNVTAAAGLTAIDCTGASHCTFSGIGITWVWDGVVSNHGWNDLSFDDFKITHFMQNGMYLASGNSTSPAVLSITRVLTNPADVAQGAVLWASGIVLDGNIVTVKINHSGGVGNTGDGVSYGDGLRFQNSSTQNEAPTLVTLSDMTYDHFSQQGFNLQNWTGPATGVSTQAGAYDVAPGFGGGVISKLTCINLVATSGSTGLGLDNCGHVTLNNCDMSSMAKGYYFGPEAADISATGCITDDAGSAGVTFGNWTTWAGSLSWTGGFIGKIEHETTGANAIDASVSGTHSVDYIKFTNCSMLFDHPISSAFLAALAAGTPANVRFTDCDGYTPAYGLTSAPSFPATTVAAVNANPYDVDVTITTSAALTLVIAPQDNGLTGRSQSYSLNPAGATSYQQTLRVPAWAHLTPTYSGGSPSWVWVGAR